MWAAAAGTMRKARGRSVHRRRECHRQIGLEISAVNLSVSTPRRLSSLALLAFSVGLGACAVPRPHSHESDLDTVASASSTLSPPEVAACLRRNDNRVSYPQGNAPQVTLRSRDGAGLIVEQWFQLNRHGQWITSFELQPVAAGTDMRVRMPTELAIAQAYARAARDLMALCSS
jgi:hypothetical protein